MKRLVALLPWLWLVGCASQPLPLSERQIAVDATSEEVLQAGVAALAERGFVIRFADAELGRIDAVFAARPGYEIRLATEPAAADTRLRLTGRQGGRPLEPRRFDALLQDIVTRLEAAR